MDPEKIGAFIAKLRKENGMTQAVLAEKLSISNRTVSKWENGDGMPDVSLLSSLTKTLGVTVDELLGGERNERVVPEVKVTEIENRDNLKNIFQILYIISLFFAIFAAVLGTVTEVYSIRAFSILFYTHWEIIFAALSFFASVAAGLFYAVGVTRLSVSFEKDDIFVMTWKKTWTLSLILSIFPALFLIRVYQYLIGFWLPFFAAALFAVLLAAFIAAYKKLSHHVDTKHKNRS